MKYRIRSFYGVALAGFFAVATVVSLEASAQVMQNLQTAAAVDLLYPVSIEDNGTDINKLSLRSAEFTLFGPIDHLFDGVLTFAGHNDEGEFVFEAHEAFVGSSKLIPRSRFRLGKFFLGLGRLNQFHQHDWPFTSAPKVQRAFFNPGRGALEAEGAADTGGEFSTLLPLPFYLDLTIGVTDGYCFGHCHGSGRRPQRPLYYLHPVLFFELGENAGLQLGLNYLSRKDHAGEETNLTGLDATFKAREGKILRWLVQSEIWHRAVHPLAAKSTSTVGSYLYTQYGFDSELAMGVRLDGYSELNRSFATTGEKQNDFDYAIVPSVTYKPSEFSTLRFSYAHEVDTTQGESDVRDRRFELQFTYILGAHPAHDF